MIRCASQTQKSREKLPRKAKTKTFPTTSHALTAGHLVELRQPQRGVQVLQMKKVKSYELKAPAPSSRAMHARCSIHICTRRQQRKTLKIQQEGNAQRQPAWAVRQRHYPSFCQFEKTKMSNTVEHLAHHVGTLLTSYPQELFRQVPRSLCVSQLKILLFAALHR